MRYRPNLGGHAPGHLREAFGDYLENRTGRRKIVLDDFCKIDEEERPVLWLIGQLWNCTDVLPGDCVSQFEDYGGLHGKISYAAAARALKKVIHIYKTNPRFIGFALEKD